jgi:hypothetical protein
MKQRSPTSVTTEGTQIDESLEHPEKQYFGSCSTPGGRQIRERDEHLRNAASPSRKCSERGSNVTVESDQHSMKQPSQSSVTAEGTRIDESDEHVRNALRPIERSFEPDSNMTAESDRHSLKQSSQSRSIEAGIRIHERPGLEIRAPASSPRLSRNQASTDKSLEPHANVIVKRQSLPLKQPG